MVELDQKLQDRETIDNADIVKVIGKYVELKSKGSEFRGICPFHNDKKASLTVKPEWSIFKCFACGEGGDVIDFLIKMGANSFPEAVKEIREMDGIIIDPVQRESFRNKKATWTPIVPAPLGAGSPNFEHYKYGHPSKVWAYKDKNALILGYVCRFNLGDGEKETWPMTYCSSGSRREWRWKGFPEPRPMYGLETDRGAPVILVEGEKVKDAAAAMFPKNDVFTWPGGSNAIHLVDWKPLYGRKIVFFPDNDQPGWLAMVGGFLKNKTTEKFTYKKGIADLLREHCPGMKVIMPNDEFKKGWDVADVKWTSTEALTYAKKRIRNVEDVREKEAPKPPKPEVKVSKPESHIEKAQENVPFRCLGYNKTENGLSEFHVYSYKANQALRFTAQSLTKSNLMQLAGTSFWEERFWSKRGFDVDAACEFVMDTCYHLGVYDAENLRGIGAWVDDKRVIVHAGDRLIVDGKKVELNDLKTRYIYEANKPFGFELKNPHKLNEANKLIQLFDLMSWERPVNAYLLTGWCIIAPVCGALGWRPHVWLTGGSGTGKSTIFGMLRIIVGKMSLAVQGTTTEAGIRQELKQDARPVIFDEMDNDSKHDAERIQNILSTVRASSSFDGGKIIKGGAMGSNRSYKIRSCFAFASITPQISTTADKSRVTVLSLKKETGESFKAEKWKAIQEKMAEIIHPEWCDQLVSRTIKMLPVILENSRIFTRAAATFLGEQRSGDQLGVLLAGAYSLYSNQVISYEKALEWVSDKDWSDIQSDEKDEINLFNHLIGATFTASTSGGSRIDKTIGELVLIADDGHINKPFDEDSVNEILDANDARDNLRRLGVKIEGDRFIVANKSNWIDRVLMGTPWAKGHGKVFLRVLGAKATESTTFAPGIKGRGVSLPISLLKEDNDK